MGRGTWDVGREKNLLKTYESKPVSHGWNQGGTADESLIRP